MARAVRYQHQPGKAEPRKPPQNAPGSKNETAEAKARAIASRAAQDAARRAEPRVRKSAARRAEEIVAHDARISDIETVQDLRGLVRTARKAVRAVKPGPMGARRSAVSRPQKARRNAAERNGTA